MLTNSANLQSGELGELGWGFKSIGKGLAKVGKGVVKSTIVNPTKMVAKSAVGVAKSSAAVGTNIARGKFKEAAKSAGRVALAPTRLAVDTTKYAAKTSYAATKAITNLALAPLRSRLNTLKNRRAQLISWQKRGSKVPTVAEKAQARKDVKSMLSSKGPHGKMMSWLAGPDTYDGLGVVGYDDAALAAIATALTASAVRIIQDAAKSKFAPADAAKAGIAAGGGVAANVAVAKLAPVAAVAQEFTEKAAALPATAAEVAQETAVAAEEAATATETEAIEGALASAGMLGGFMDALPAAAAPEAMSESMARKIAGASQRVVCGMPAQALAAIGGLPAVNIVGSFCRSLAAGDEAGVRATLPNVVKIASRISADVATQAFSNVMPNEGFGCGSCLGRSVRRGKKAGRYSPFNSCVNFQMDRMGASQANAEYACQGALQGLDSDEIGMLAAFNGADLAGLSFGLAGVSPDDIAASSSAGSGSILVLLPAGLAVLAGLWMATH